MDLLGTIKEVSHFYDKSFLSSYEVGFLSFVIWSRTSSEGRTYPEGLLA